MPVYSSWAKTAGLLPFSTLAHAPFNIHLLIIATTSPYNIPPPKWKEETVRQYFPYPIPDPDSRVTPLFSFDSCLVRCKLVPHSLLTSRQGSRRWRSCWGPPPGAGTRRRSRASPAATGGAASTRYPGGKWQ